MKKVVKRSIKLLGIIIGSFITLLVIITLVINFLFRDQVIRVVIDQLNKQVDAKINIGKVDFSIWKNFPNASVQFDKVFAQSANQYKLSNGINNPDTLLKAESIFFEFNLLKLIRGKYELKRINVKNGYVKLKIDKEGKANYDIIKPGKGDSQTSLSLELKDLIFINTYLEYNDIRSSILIEGLAEKLRIRGNFKASTFEFKINTAININKLIISNYSYLLKKHVDLSINLLVNDKKYVIKDAGISIVNCSFDAEGEFDLGENPTINLMAEGNRLNLAQVMDALPDNIKESLKEYSGKGQASARLLIKGPVGKNGTPLINIHCSLKDATVTHKSTGIKLEDIFLDANFSNRLSKSSQVSVIKIDKFYSKLGSGKVSGNCIVENMTNPYLKLNLLYKIDLFELKQFLSLDTLEILKGYVDGNMAVSGLLKHTADSTVSDFSGLQITGQTKLHEGGIKVKNNDYYFERINGDITLNNDLYFTNISLFVLDNDFLINGSLNNGLNYLLKRSKSITLQAEVTSRNLDLSKYFVNDKKPNSNEYSRALLFPENINLDVKLTINNFKLNKFNAKWAVGNLTYKPTMFILKAMSFETLSGKVNGNGIILQDLNKNFIVKGQVDVSRLDIKQMFYTFNNFSQDVLRDQHLKGRVSGKIGISSEWNNLLTLNTDKVLVDADITIENGELVNFEPMMGLSRFISVDELKNIKFSTLKNRIYIKDKQIIIPQMEVKSSAFDLSASGTHLFDNHYTYKLRLLLSDVLWGKAKRAKKENAEFGEVEDDGLGKTSLFLSITGFNKDYKITYDSKKTLGVVKEGFKKQGSELKSVLNEEFGWFKKDTLLHKKVEKKPKFKVQWDDDDADVKTQINNDKTKEKVKTNNEEKQKIEWE